MDTFSKKMMSPLNSVSHSTPAPCHCEDPAVAGDEAISQERDCRAPMFIGARNDNNVFALRLAAALTFTILYSLFISHSLFAASAPTSHTIIWGDTLAMIAVRYYGAAGLYPALAAANKIPNPHLIIAGRTLNLPPASDLKGPPAPQPSATAIPTEAKAVLAPPPEPPAAPEAPAFVWRKVDNIAFSVGERLTFEIKWQFITAGIAVMDIREIVAPPTAPSRPSYKIVTEARSAPFIDNFFKVRDENISYLDVESICSHTLESNISEGNFSKKETVVFDQINHTFALSDGKTGPTEPWVQDVLGALYYARLLPLVPGAEFSFPAHSGDKTYPLLVKVLGRETVRVPAGEFECFKLEPALRGDGVFKAQGRLWVWVTSDERRMPVLM
ncbi:MAG: DUF3108 domain-containing protein, partial [Endomicrobiia bacterium]|nr:DUF3108 domain-containing protein [Endomicrobiia bacterium]